MTTQMNQYFMDKEENLVFPLKLLIQEYFYELFCKQKSLVANLIMQIARDAMDT